MDVFKMFATDRDKEEGGTEVKIGPDTYITVARSNNRKFAKQLSKRVEENREILDSGTEEADQLSDEIMREVLADTILLGWRNLDYKGKPIKYTRENAIELLKMPDFMDFVMKHAKQVDHFRVKIEENVVKN